MSVLYSKEFLDKLHRTRTAKNGIVYTREDNVLFIGNPEGFLERAKDILGNVKGKSLNTSLEKGLDTFTFRQAIAATTWVVVHTLNKKPAVTVVDSMGTQVEGQVVYINNTLLNINFNAAFSGTAYLN